MKNFKKIFSIALTLSVIICFAGCKEAAEDKQAVPTADVLEEKAVGERIPYKIVQTNNNGQICYTYYLYDNSGNIAYKETMAKEPVIQNITDSVIEIRDIHGSGDASFRCKYYDLSTGAMSEWWWNTFYTDGKIAVHLGHDDNDSTKVFLVVRDVFDKSRLYKEINWDYPEEITVPSEAVKGVKRIDENTLEIEYIQGNRQTKIKVNLA